jgi:hypothetical protein
MMASAATALISPESSMAFFISASFAMNAVAKAEQMPPWRMVCRHSVKQMSAPTRKQNNGQSIRNALCGFRVNVGGANVFILTVLAA